MGNSALFFFEIQDIWENYKILRFKKKQKILKSVRITHAGSVSSSDEPISEPVSESISEPVIEPFMSL